MKIDDIKEIIEREICSYERNRNTANKEAAKQAIMRDCYNDFIYLLKDILEKIEKE